MRPLAIVLFAALAAPAWAEMRDEEHRLGDKLVKIAVFDTLEIMTVGPSDYEKMQVLSGADLEIQAIVDDADTVALLGQPVVVVEVTGTHSCEAGDAREYWVVTLGAVPAPEGPVTTCQPLTASVAAGTLVMTGTGEAWTWVPGKGWAARAG